MAWGVANTIPIYAIQDSKPSRQWERRAQQIWFSSSRSIASFLTHRTAQGKFWGGGRSFPSGHSATSFAFAAVVAHRYPKNKWVKWGAYALATGVSLSRYAAKKHYPSDILIGATLGYVTG